MKYAKHSLKAVQYRKQYYAMLADQIDYILGYKPRDDHFYHLVRGSEACKRSMETRRRMLLAGRGRLHEKVWP